jgi:hypothetical protein
MAPRDDTDQHAQETKEPAISHSNSSQPIAEILRNFGFVRTAGVILCSPALIAYKPAPPLLWYFFWAVLLGAILFDIRSIRQHRSTIVPRLPEVPAETVPPSPAKPYVPETYFLEPESAFRFKQAISEAQTTIFLDARSSPGQTSTFPGWNNPAMLAHLDLQRSLSNRITLRVARGSIPDVNAFAEVICPAVRIKLLPWCREHFNLKIRTDHAAMTELHQLRAAHETVRTPLALVFLDDLAGIIMNNQEFFQQNHLDLGLDLSMASFRDHFQIKQALERNANTIWLGEQTTPNILGKAPDYAAAVTLNGTDIWGAVFVDEDVGGGRIGQTYYVQIPDRFTQENGRNIIKTGKRVVPTTLNNESNTARSKFAQILKQALFKEVEWTRDELGDLVQGLDDAEERIESFIRGTRLLQPLPLFTLPT